MNPRDLAMLGVALASVALLVWFRGADGPSLVVGIVLGAVGLRVATQLFALYSRVSGTGSTMGPQGDAIVGFDARVVTVEPLQVEVLGSMWRARLVEGVAVAPEGRVRVVGREVLTLLVAGPKQDTDRR